MIYNASVHPRIREDDMATALPMWMEDYLAQRAAEGLAVVSLQGFRNRLKPLARFLVRYGARKAAEVTPADLDRYLTSMAARGVSWRSRRSGAVSPAPSARSFSGVSSAVW